MIMILTVKDMMLKCYSTDKMLQCKTVNWLTESFLPIYGNVILL